MRSCLGLIFLIILVSAMLITAFYQWDSNNHIEFSIRNDGDPALTQSKQPIDDALAEANKGPKIVADDAMQMNIPTPEEEQEQATADSSES